MTQEKQLLLKDLCARLPYGVMIQSVGEVKTLGMIDIADIDLFMPKPYLRHMSSITEKEKEEILPFFSKFTDDTQKKVLVVRQNKMALYQDWLNAHHFDYRGLIEKGLAIEAPENMYK